MNPPPGDIDRALKQMLIFHGRPQVRGDRQFDAVIVVMAVRINADAEPAIRVREGPEVRARN